MEQVRLRLLLLQLGLVDDTGEVERAIMRHETRRTGIDFFGIATVVHALDLLLEVLICQHVPWKQCLEAAKHLLVSQGRIKVELVGHRRRPVGVLVVHIDVD